MSTMKTHNKPCFRSKIILRLWIMMMSLVVIGILFMWTAQILLFEQNYVDSARMDIQNGLELITEDLETQDLAGNETLLGYLSKTISGKLVIASTDGVFLVAYSMGHPLEMHTDDLRYFWEGLRQNGEYDRLSQGESYSKVIRYGTEILNFEMGIPVTYDGQPAYAFLHQPLDEVYTVLNMNRRQLTALSIILTILAAILAAILSRLFVKPIFKLKSTVDRLAAGDLDATPELHRGDELGQLSDSVEELGQALKRVDVLRKEVIANVSHEMRSPLALIIGYAEMVRDLNWQDDVKREEDLNLIIQEARRMSEMVKDIMDYSQFQAGFMQLNIVSSNLCEIVESEVLRCKPSASEHDIAITQIFERDDMPVDVDAIKICLVIRNLLSNAINHTKDGEEIIVSVKNAEKGICVEVMNPGDPIPEEDRTLIWERYQRSQHQAGRRQGTGIGLSIVSTILKAHGIPYGVDCENGKTIFWFMYTTDKDRNGGG